MGSHDSGRTAAAGNGSGGAAGGAAGGAYGRRRGRRRVPVTAGLVGVGLLAVAGAAGRAWVDETGDLATPTCPVEATRTVVIAVDRTIADPLTEATAGLGRRPLDVGGCVQAVIRAQDPLETAAELAALPADQLPDLWVPDSSTWLDRVADPESGGPVRLVSLGSLASSPLVVAANGATVTQQGWQAQTPTWAEVLTSGLPVALPDLSGSAAGVSALLALRDSVVAQAPADQGKLQVQQALTTVAGAIDPDRVPTLDAGFELAAAGGPDAPVIPTSEQQWFLRTRGQQAPPTVAIRPRDGSAVLDYPLVRVGRQGQDVAAVQGIVEVLERDGRERARAWGFSRPLDAGASGRQSTSAVGGPPVMAPPTAEQVDVLLADLARLSRPTRALVVVDASISMRAPTSSGIRASLARDAVKTSLSLFPDTAGVGLWFFAIGMGGADQDWTEVVPIRRLDEDAGGVSQRAAVLAGTDTLVDRLTPGGTGLNDTVLAAVRAVREQYDPEASDVVVVVTDGRSEDPAGVSTAELIATLQAENDPSRPVRVIAVGLAQDSDSASLTSMAEATGGAAYLAERPEDFQAVLFDALRRRG